MSQDLTTVHFLRSSADGLAGLATSRLFESDGWPESEDFGAWKGHLREHVLKLSAAIQSGNPQGFANHVGWVRQSFLARELPADDLRSAVLCLQEVALDALPDSSVAVIGKHFKLVLEQLDAPSPVLASELDPAIPMHALALRFVRILRQGDTAGARLFLSAAIANGEITLIEVIDEVLTPAMREVGRLWHMSELSVAEEHFISNATRVVLGQLLLEIPQNDNPPSTVLLTAVQGDAHSLGIEFVAAHFVIRGWKTICLGADTPTSDIPGAVESFGAQVVLLSATIESQIPQLVDAIGAIRAAQPHTKIIAGGQAFRQTSQTAEEIGADGLAQTASEAFEIASRL